MRTATVQRRRPAVHRVVDTISKVPQGIPTFVKRLKDPKLLDKDAVEGRVLPIYTHVCIKCWQLLHLVALRMNLEFMKLRSSSE